MENSHHPTVSGLATVLSLSFRGEILYITVRGKTIPCIGFCVSDNGTCAQTTSPIVVACTESTMHSRIRYLMIDQKPNTLSMDVHRVTYKARQ